MLNFLLRIPEPLRAKGQYAIEILSAIWGIPVAFAGDSQHVDVVYGGTPPENPGVLNLPFDTGAYESGSEYIDDEVMGVKIWRPLEVPALRCDLIGSTFRLITFMDESHVSEKCRDKRGIFSVASLPSARREMRFEPLVENHARILLHKIRALRPTVVDSAVALWPYGKKYALAISHDTDAITIGYWREMLYNIAKALLRRDANSWRMFKEGFAFINRPNENPLWGFPRWRQIEGPTVRSCFFLFAKPRNLKADLNDCRSTVVEQNIDWSTLRSMAQDGWEFGLHAPIHARDDLNGLSWGKAFVEERIGRPVFGLRHHYWALDWRRPHLTFRKHMEAGFRYDTSIAWRDSAGFRAGTCLPFRPFDPDRAQALDFYELPTAIMDGHIRGSGAPVEENVADGLELVGRVKSRGGVVLLNWHTETACDDYGFRGDRAAFFGVLTPMLTDPDVWITTPWELIQHCDQRWRAMARLACEAPAA